MPRDIQGLAESEPPSTIVSDDAASDVLADRIMAVAHLQSSAHVAVIGHHTLSFVLALLHQGCGVVRSLRPGAPSPDCEPSDLAWIVDVLDEHELDEALRAARLRAGETGRVIVEGAGYRGQGGLAAILAHARALGFNITCFDHHAQRFVLAAVRHQTLAA